MGKKGPPKGVTNNPYGRAKDKMWADAIRLEAMERAGKGDKRKLRELATVLFDKAMDGDIAAITEIGNRLDGRPTQAVEASVTADLGSSLMEFLKYMQEQPPQPRVIDGEVLAEGEETVLPAFMVPPRN